MQQELKNSQNNRLIRSFGRIKSRKLSDHKNFLLENFMPKYELSEQIPKQVQDDDVENSELDHKHKVRHSELVSGSISTKNFLEIGFGFGDFTFEKAKQNPNISFFGSEPHINGVINLLSKLEMEPLPNLKVSREDVRLLLVKFPEKFFDQVYILFPDPWPKSKHFKRRLINTEFLDTVLSPRMKTGSKLTIATDHDSYKIWILAEIANSKKFTWDAKSKKDWQVFPQDWVTTKYQKKAAQEGRTSVIFNLTHTCQNS
jgi:tRNA (guanine-N7-)-methyltransferase